ncbi:MAG TPA: bifunctional transaldolase/phosoglucose isomerase [Terriglobales bacterium]|nr:bifunctional transaldolase/phosoglucose isomerase [Terriglobales bacterium]
MPNPLQRLHDFGQSFWYDNIRRELLLDGGLARMVREDGLRGLTSNPTIFAKALAAGSEYDDSIRRVWKETPAEVFLDLMVEDIQGACDVLRPVFDQSGGADGFASIEVFPDLAHDTAGTLTQARMLWKRVARPNVMVKIPSTPECIAAIASALEAGININITLMFGFESYRAVVEAYLAALEKRLAAGHAIDRLASVASLFVSRVDTKLDPRLQAHPELQGKAGIANARRMYQYFQQSFSGPRWEKLAAAGARPQRLLWASTSTKNPAYPDTLYADALIGAHTVDTMPDQTVAAFRDHGRPADRLGEAMANYAAEVDTVLRALAQAGVDMEAVALELQNEGVDSFQKSYDELIAGLRAKVARLSQQLTGPRPLLDTAAAALAGLKSSNFGAQIWAPHAQAATLWSPAPAVQSKIADRLGWLTVLDAMRAAVPQLEAFRRGCQDAGYTDAVVLGMGGSSLAPDVFSEVFDHETGLNVHVLDTTDPDQILHLERQLKLAHTLFLVSSKSGGTIEPNSLFAYFWSQLGDGAHYAAITDAGTSLEKLARDHKFRHVFTNPGDIGGRYSALSYFGLVPAALQGVDVARLLDGATEMALACSPATPLDQNPGVVLGAALGAWANAGRDKLTFVPHPEIQSLGWWLEQLIAESTGKNGKGIVPVAGETLGDPSVYGADRVFAQIGVGPATPALESAMTALAATAPVVRIQLRDRYDLGREFFRWEFATAVAGQVLQINPFDEPNVQESKDNTVRVLGEYLKGGPAAAGFTTAPNAHLDGMGVFTPAGDLRAWLTAIRPGDYVAVMAYLERSPEIEVELEALRNELRDRLRVATTLGFGPRFLHSTGQLHKGGANSGVFLQITGAPAAHCPIPGQKYDFAALLAAQAMGDYQSLLQHQRRLARVDVGTRPLDGIKQLQAFFSSPR